MKTALIPALAVLGVSVASLPAHAQATRTFISGVGNDADPCSRTAPCRTFAGAIVKTFINGEINCLDPGGYGTVSITKSITIDCKNTLGSDLASGTTGIIINIAPNVNDPQASVRLRGLTINGTGASGAVGTVTGIRGIKVNNGGRPIKLSVDEVFIQNFTTEGIFFNAPGGELVVRNSVITNVINGPAIRTLSTAAGAAGIIHVSITGTTTYTNQQGIRFEGNSFGVVSNSKASNNTLNGFVVFPASIGGAEMNIVDSTANNNKQFGIFAAGTGQTGVVRIFNVTAFHNTTNQLVAQAGGSILSNGRNHIGVPTQAPGVFNDQ